MKVTVNLTGRQFVLRGLESGMTVNDVKMHIQRQEGILAASQTLVASDAAAVLPDDMSLEQLGVADGAELMLVIAPSIKICLTDPMAKNSKEVTVLTSDSIEVIMVKASEALFQGRRLGLRMKLLLKGKLLDPKSTVQESAVEDGSTLMVLLGSRGGADPEEGQLTLKCVVEIGHSHEEHLVFARPSDTIAELMAKATAPVLMSAAERERVQMTLDSVDFTARSGETLADSGLVDYSVIVISLRAKDRQVAERRETKKIKLR